MKYSRILTTCGIKTHFIETEAGFRFSILFRRLSGSREKIKPWNLPADSESISPIRHLADSGFQPGTCWKPLKQPAGR